MQEISWSAEDKDKGSPLPFETSSLLLLPPPVLWWGVQSVVCIAVLYWQNLHWSMKPSSSCNCYIIIITRHNVAVCSTRHAAPEQRLHPPDNVNRHRPLWRQHRLQAGPVMGKPLWKKSKYFVPDPDASTRSCNNNAMLVQIGSRVEDNACLSHFSRIKF